MRYVATVLAALVLGPLMIAAGAVAATGILGELFNFQLLDFSDISLLDWLAGGPGAGANSFENYVTFMIGAMIALGCYVALHGMWEWARRERS